MKGKNYLIGLGGYHALLCVALAFMALFLFHPAALAQGPAIEAWVARYNGPGNNYDEARAIAVDGQGNVYVTGQSFNSESWYGYATIKYDSYGNVLWVQRYLGFFNNAYAIAVDGQGNVYVTGESWDGGTSQDYATIKYDSNGNELWVRRYHGLGYDIARAMAVDGQGNVYVTGESWGGFATDSDYATIKYDTNGNELWARRYNGPGNSFDRPRAIAVDGQGNVYVTGSSYSSGTNSDYATIKYDANGTELWVQRYNGPVNGWDQATAIALDGQGNVYVTGESAGSRGDSDYATIKYDTNGNELWVRRYNHPLGPYYDIAYAMALDGQGNVYVTGQSGGYATIKYDTNGNELWVRRYNGPANLGDSANAIALDGQGNVYVTGESFGSGTSWDYATIKYDTNGNELWVRRHNGPGNDSDFAKAIAVDGQGNVYVTGSSAGSGTNTDYATIKYVRPIAVAIDIKRGTDYDGDGKADMGIWRTSDGGWHVLGSTLGPYFAGYWGSTGLGDVLVPGDYDGGLADLAVWRSSTGEWFILKSSGGYEVLPWGDASLGDTPVAADYDGDGTTDVAIWRASDGGWYVLGSSSGPYLAGYWGSSTLGDIPVPADYDGDGRADLAVWRTSTGEWFILKSSGGYEVHQWGDVSLGDRPVPADYDGDGKTDVAIWRSSDGGWYVLGSISGPYFAGYWGSNALGDVPVPGNYDGVGGADLAVWRSSTGEWFILKSSGGYEIHQWGDASLGDLPMGPR